MTVRLVRNESISKLHIRYCSDDWLLSLKGWKNIVGKEENDGYQHFLLFLQCFENALFSNSFKTGLFVKGLMLMECE